MEWLKFGWDPYKYPAATSINAMNSEHGDEYRESMSIDMTALQKVVTWSTMHWSQVSRGANILLLTWLYKLKQVSRGMTVKFQSKTVFQRRPANLIKALTTWTSMLHLSTGPQCYYWWFWLSGKSYIAGWSILPMPLPLKRAVYCELPIKALSTDGSNVVLKLNKSLDGQL